MRMTLSFIKGKTRVFLAGYFRELNLSTGGRKETKDIDSRSSRYTTIVLINGWCWRLRRAAGSGLSTVRSPSVSHCFCQEDSLSSPLLSIIIQANSSRHGRPQRRTSKTQSRRTKEKSHILCIAGRKRCRGKQTTDRQTGPQVFSCVGNNLVKM